MASEQFDPYHKWLGIPPHEQPPSHYRLLRISEYESDQDFSVKVKSGSRVFIGDGVRIEVMDAPARLNYYQLLSVNSASAEDLALIPGIGMRTAEAIVSYRVNNKSIKDLPELRAVKGIGEKKLQVLVSYLGLSDYSI